MNVRKPVDYSAMFAVLDTLMTADLPQMKLYSEIGRLVSGRTEKGAAVAAAEYLRVAYSDAVGFSPRNLRRMREFYRAYENTPEILARAMTIGWTQNVIILEAELTLQVRAWYIQAARQFRWSKLELQRKITANAHLEILLDFTAEVCYTEEETVSMECIADDKRSICLPWQYLQKPDGRVYYERFGEEGRFRTENHYRIGNYQYRRDWKSCLSTGPPQAGRAWDQLLWQESTPASEQRL